MLRPLMPTVLLVAYPKPMWEQGTDQEYPIGQPPEPRPRRVTKAGLKGRGWTDKMIRELLGEPDAREENPYSAKHELCLYLLERVEEVERSDTFFELLDRSEKYKELGAKGAAKGKATRLARLQSQVEGLEIVLPKLEPEELIQQACDRYNAWVKSNDVEREPATPEGNAWFLSFISVNFLRHEVPGYRDLYDSLRNQLGADEGRRRLDERIYQTIAQTYPTLTEECERQNKRKLFPTPKQLAARDRAKVQREKAKEAKGQRRRG